MTPAPVSQGGKALKLIIAGGGTGGHLFPGIAVAEEFLSRDPANQVLFIGTERGIESRVVPASGYRLELISSAGIRGKGAFGKLKGALMMLYGYSQSRAILKSFRPDIVLGVGGYASLPMVLASRGMQIPCFVHEQNAIPGMSNKLLARVADQAFISLEESARYFPKRNTFLTGNPLRRQILAQAGQSAGTQADGEGEFRLLIFGGSQGAHAINQAMTAALPFLKDRAARLEITHQTGEKEADDVSAAYRAQGFTAAVSPFINDMASAYQHADLVICRAGATTIAELTACGRPAIFIPFPYAVDDHQRRNAEALLKKGAGFMLLEQELSGERLANMIRELMDNPEVLQKTGELASSLARLDAAQVIVDEMVKRLG
jgi:UDP-N-acetylglucosamine--N-acetylmuramyl-(pentapeptide) pyrophosphoryl-undecaprenol N-acetylglucosamine transferase